MRKIRLYYPVLLFFAGLCFTATLKGEEVWGARFPAASPDGKKITFSYYGDIWMVSAEGGRAERLTVSDGYESRSFWSADGKWIAFMSDRWGNDEICVMPADASQPPNRLTYYSTSDNLYGWTPDGNYIIFSSLQHTLRTVLYRVPLKGGLPEMVTDFNAAEACFLPDGKRFLYSRGGDAWWRRRYQGGANQEIWLKSLAQSGSIRLTRSPGRDGYPMYSRLDNRIYFLSNRAEPAVDNIWRMNLDGGSVEQVTFQKEDAHFPEMSWSGQVITYECLGYIYTYDLASGQTRKLEINVDEDDKQPQTYFEEFTADATEFALSPDEHELAFIVHGDIFVMELKKDDEVGKMVQVTSTPYIEKHLSWHPQKELLVYSSTEDGDMDIYTIKPRTEAKFFKDLLFDKNKILNTDVTEVKPRYSPDGELIAYFKNKNELFVMDKNGSASRRLCPENDVLWIDWSADSKWITFSRTTLGWREDIFVVPADASDLPVNISNHPNDDYKPMWSSDGRRIAFGSRDPLGHLWMKYVFLLKEDEERDNEYWEKEEPDSSEKTPIVRIDFDDIEERIHTVTEVLGEYNYVAQSADGKQFAIQSGNQNSDDIWTVDWRGKELKRVTENNVEPKMFSVTKDRQRIYYLSGTGRIYSADIGSASSTPLAFSAELEIDRHLEREQVFDEAWWALQDGFYDSDFHGVNWKAMFYKYRDLALKMRTTRDFHSVVSTMIGELNASHLGIWKDEAGGEETGVLGIVYDVEYDGDGIRVKDVIPESPASEQKVGIDKGDIITCINDQRLVPGENFYKYLRNKSGKEVMLTIQENGKLRNVKVTLISPWQLAALVDKSWVKANREYVNERSKNRLGYLYIASMGESDLVKFEKDLYKEMNKDGLIIDIRYNGGGSIHDELLNILRRTAYAYSMERGGQKEYSSLFKWDKPTVVLINELCYSDAEIFPAGFKQLKLGRLIGVPTFGAVIGTNDIELLDGSTFRVPGTGWFRINGENLENKPVEPDIYVENSPEEDGSSQDQQLTRAIDVLLEDIKKK